MVGLVSALIDSHIAAIELFLKPYDFDLKRFIDTYSEA